MRIKGIACDTLNFILKTSKSMVPEEFAGLSQEKDGIITEVLMLPGTESSEQNAVLKLFMMLNVKAAARSTATQVQIANLHKLIYIFFQKQEVVT